MLACTPFPHLGHLREIVQASLSTNSSGNEPHSRHGSSFFVTPIAATQRMPPTCCTCSSLGGLCLPRTLGLCLHVLLSALQVLDALSSLVRVHQNIRADTPNFSYGEKARLLSFLLCTFVFSLSASASYSLFLLIVACRLKS